AVRAHSDPDIVNSAAPKEPPPAASPKWVGRSECTCHISLLRCDTTRRRSNPKAAGHLSTSTSTILSCTHSPPCRPGPASLPHLAPDCTLRRPAPGPPNPHAELTTCLDKFLLSSCPFSALISLRSSKARSHT